MTWLLSIGMPPVASAANAVAMFSDLLPITNSASLWAALIAAFAGGVVLNLMPCVLPVLSLKAMMLVSNPVGSRAGKIAAGAYAAGVMSAFLVLGLLVLFLRQAGEAAGWGFQLQSPVFVGLLALLMTLLGLWMADAIELRIGVPGSLSSRMLSSGPAADFWSGALIVLLASPCVGPFMGPALAYGLSVGGLGAMSIFAALAAGLAAPFVLLAFVPRLGRWLPRPGVWMKTFKQVLALPMLLTAVWLLYVLAGQVSAAVLALFLGAVVIAAFLGWMVTCVLTGRSALLRWAFAAIGVLVVGGGVKLVSQPSPAVSATAWQGITYSARDLAQLRGENRKILLAVTARWCATCMANEQLVLGTDKVADLLTRENVVLMRADFTDNDPAVAALLKEHNAAGVPLYIHYRADGSSVKLPQILSVATLAESVSSP